MAILFCSDIGVVCFVRCGWDSHAFIYNATGIQCFEYPNLIDSQASVARGEVPARWDGSVKNHPWSKPAALAILVALKRGNFGYLRDWNFSSALSIWGQFRSKHTHRLELWPLYGSFKPTLFFFIRCNTIAWSWTPVFCTGLWTKPLQMSWKGPGLWAARCFRDYIQYIMISRTSDLMM